MIFFVFAFKISHILNSAPDKHTYTCVCVFHYIMKTKNLRDYLHLARKKNGAPDVVQSTIDN